MKVNYKELMNKLGVGRPLNVYETQPWIYYDDEKGMTCEAEVRCNHDKTRIEAEIQLMHDNPEDGQLPVEQICLIHMEEQKRLNGDYTVTACWIKSESWVNKIYDWETKSVSFFRSCVREIKADRMPDFDDLLSKEMRDGNYWAQGEGDGSNKSPKINTSNLLYDMKNKGRGF